MKSLLDKDYKYVTAAKSREPGYLQHKFEEIRKRPVPVSNVAAIKKVKARAA